MSRPGGGRRAAWQSAVAAALLLGAVGVHEAEPSPSPADAPRPPARASTLAPSPFAQLASAPSPAGPARAPATGQTAPLNLNGRPLGAFRLTYYRLAEADAARAQPAPGWLPVHGRDCTRVLAWVPEAFHSDLGLQGSGLLPDGRLLNFEQRCSCAVPTRRGERICYAELKRTEFPFGRGAQWNRQYFWLQPLRSAAVDPAVVPMGTVLYVPALEGRALEHGMAHNGCIRAEDTGRAIRGRHLDLFSGSTRAAPDVPAKLPRGDVAVFVDARRCTGAFP